MKVIVTKGPLFEDVILPKVYQYILCVYRRKLQEELEKERQLASRSEPN